MTPSRQRKQTKRQALLQAARELFTQKGYHQSSLEEIVQAAETGKGTLYHHFRDKDDLVDAVITMVRDELYVRLKTEAAVGFPPVEKLEKLITTYVEFLQENSGLWRMLLFEVPDKRRIRRNFRPVVQLIEDVLEEGRRQGILEFADAHIAADIIFAAANIHTLHPVTGEGPAPDGKAVSRLLLYGLRGRSTDGCVAPNEVHSTEL